MEIFFVILWGWKDHYVIQGIVLLMEMHLILPISIIVSSNSFKTIDLVSHITSPTYCNYKNAWIVSEKLKLYLFWKEKSLSRQMNLVISSISWAHCERNWNNWPMTFAKHTCFEPQVEKAEWKIHQKELVHFSNKCICPNANSTFL